MCSKKMFFKVILFFAYFYAVFCQYLDVGDKCSQDGGVCKKLGQCRSVLELQKQNRRYRPQICFFSDTEPIVCCKDKESVRPSPQPAEALDEYYDEEEEENIRCAPLDPSIALPKNGRKAFDKCIEYQEKYVYPCGASVSLLGLPSRSKNCHHETDKLIIAGTDAAKYEFPHMALLGYQSNTEIKYECGGSIISENFILTAGHCLGHKDYGPVKFIVIGVLKRSEIQPRNRYKVKNATGHPKYKPPAAYNDIALLETDRPMALDQFTVPVCLHTGDSVDESSVLASGWGVTHYKGKDLSDNLKKAILNKYTTAECSEKYTGIRWLKQGFDQYTQTCYGERDSPKFVEGRLESKDTCNGDSGGPIQIKNAEVHCMYTVVGVTSLGKFCGFNDKPGLYTRVAHFVPWIEKIVWPN